MKTSHKDPYTPPRIKTIPVADEPLLAANSHPYSKMYYLRKTDIHNTYSPSEQLGKEVEFDGEDGGNDASGNWEQ